MTDLTILCISRFGDHARPFIERLSAAAADIGALFVLGADGPSPWWAFDLGGRMVHVHSSGYVESVLEQVISACADGWILRIDDDEQLSPRMVRWLAAGSYRDALHWAFPRMHLWPDDGHYVRSQPLWPDLQTRLSVKELAGGRDRIHAGSPHGTGKVAGVAIEHHKFLVRDLAERERLLEQYETLQPGAGRDFEIFSIPERHAGQLVTWPVS